MEYFDVTYHSRIYRDFRAISTEDYPSIVHYYEDHETGIQALDFSEYFEMLAAYTYALYGINEHSKHILMADVLVAEAINNNIKEHKEEDIFYNTLLRKAVSCNLLMRYADGEHILRELLKIQPDNEFTQRELKRCLGFQTPKYLHQARAASVVLFLVSAVVIFIELIFIRHFYPHLTHYFEYTRIALFVLGLLLLAVAEVYFKLEVRKNTKKLIERAFQHKKKDGTNS